MADEDEWSMDKIRKMVEGTKGYYVRDYSLGLGWNNVGYFLFYFVLFYLNSQTYWFLCHCLHSDAVYR